MYIFSPKTSVFRFTLCIFSLKTWVAAQNVHFWHFQRQKNIYFCKNIFSIIEFLRNLNIFNTFEITEIMTLKLDWNFCKIIIPPQLLIKYSIMFMKRIALLFTLWAFEKLIEKKIPISKSLNKVFTCLGVSVLKNSKYLVKVIKRYSNFKKSLYD